MKFQKALFCLCLVLGIPGLSGCATIVSGRNANVSITSNPPAALVAVHNEKGETVATATTPATVSLRRSQGIFRKAPRYSATIEKPGYQTSQVRIDPKINPWIIGNVALGGVIGLAADSATGAMWRYTPDEIHQDLTLLSNSSYASSPAIDEKIVPASYDPSSGKD